jgi:hypothetical protein
MAIAPLPAPGLVAKAAARRSWCDLPRYRLRAAGRCAWQCTVDNMPAGVGLRQTKSKKRAVI